MNISCPHCGTEYDAEENEYGRYVKCEICGKGFVAGASRPKKNAVRGGTDNVNANIERKRARTPFVVDVGGTRSRRINIYGYREWFIGRRPVRVFVGFSETPIFCFFYFDS